MLMSIAGTLCVWSAASGSGSGSALESVHEPPSPVRSAGGRAPRERVLRCTRVSHTQAVDSWKAVELRGTANFHFFRVCFALTFYAPSYRNILFVNARAEGIHLFIYSFLFVFYLHHSLNKSSILTVRRELSPVPDSR